MKLLVLGSNGMAGHMICKYLTEKGYCVDTAARSDAKFLIDVENFSQTTEFLEYIKKYMCEIKNESNNIIFNILNTFYNPELGWLLSGYLKSGELNINDDLYLYQSLSESIHGIKIKSIHCSSGTLITTKKKISAPQVLTLCIDNIDDINIKYGFISNTIYDMINNIDDKVNNIVDIV